MKIKNKGFTLIEILASLVVLTIVMLIAVPLTLNIIDNAKKRSFIASSIVISDDIKNGMIKDIIETNIDSNSLEGTIFLDDTIRTRLQIGSNYDGYIVATKNGNTFENRLFISDTKAKLSICDETNETVTVKKVYNASSCSAVLSGIQIKSVDTDSIDTEILDNTTMKLLAYFNDKDVIEADKKVLWEEVSDDTLSVSISDSASLKPTFTFNGYGETVIKLTSLVSGKEDRVKIIVYPHVDSIKIVKLDGSAIDDKVFEVGTTGNLVAVFEPDIANMHYVEWSVLNGQNNVVIEQVGDREVNVKAVHTGSVTLKAYSPLTEISKEVIFTIREDSPPEFGACKLENTAVTNGTVNILINVFDTGGSGYKHTVKPDSTITTLSTFTYPVTTNGTYKFTSFDFDNNSNACEVVVSNIDKTSPTASIASSNTSYTNQNITLTITASDANFSHIIMPDNSTVLTKTATYIVSANNTYTFKAYDKAGNILTKTFTVSNIDKVNPALTLTQNPTAYTNGNVTITAASSDALSGFYRVLLPNSTYSTSASATYAVSSNGTYSFTTYDNAGNSLVKTITVSNIDKTAPTFSTCAVTSSTASSKTITVTATDTGGSGYYRTLRPNSTYSSSSTFTYDVTVSGTYTFTAYDNAGNSKACNVSVIINAANPPVLASGMTPIKWSGSTMVTTTASDSDWYDYGTDTKKWANAKTADGSMWVWIPRYAYQITSGYHSNATGTIAVKFLNGTTNTAFDGSSASAVSQGSNPGSNTKYVTHPAFKFGSTEVTGIWVMKFESSSNSGNIASVPTASSWSSVSISNMFNYSRSMETNSVYGWGTSGNGINTHMLKDVEWGAIAYLSRSNYGKSSEVWKNNTTYTGCTGSSIHESYSSSCKNAYNTSTGMNASTTGNYYGVYDMSGGLFEYTAGYLGSSGYNDSSLASANSMYTDIYAGNSADSEINYSYNTGYYGNAIYETSSNGTGNSSWNTDTSLFVASKTPFFHRGGHYTHTTVAGVFAFDSPYGNGYANSACSWRSTLIVQSGL